MNKKIGIFSGSFDPVHIGHVEAALVARSVLEMEKVLILIEKNPKRKSIGTSYNDRLAMLRLALADYQSLEALDHNQDHITVAATLSYLDEHYPDYTPVLIIGSDMLEYIEFWQDSAELFARMDIVVVLRSLGEQEKTDNLVKKLEEQHGATNFTVLPPVWSPVSSTSIKRELAQNSTSEFLHKDVLAYIKSEKLYLASSLDKSK